MAPSGIIMMLISPLSSRITNSHGPKVTLMFGAIVVAIGYGIGIFAMHSIWELIVIAVIIGAGTGMAYGAMPALIMGAVPPSETGAANSFNTLMRSLGTSFASAIAGVVIAQMTMSVGGATLPSENAFRVVMALAAGSAVIALVLAGFLPRFDGSNSRKEIGSEPHRYVPRPRRRNPSRRTEQVRNTHSTAPAESNSAGADAFHTFCG